MSTRRSFIQHSTVAVAGLRLTQSCYAEQVLKQAPHAKQVIMLYMSGGMSHIDGLDPKPDNPEVQGDTKVIPTNVDGIQVGEHFKSLSKVMDKCAIIRSMSTTQGAHLQGSYYQHTSYFLKGTIRHPSISAWVSRMAGTQNETLPTSVVINETSQGLASSSGYMEAKFSALPLGDAEMGLANLRVPERIGQKRQDARMNIMEKMNQTFAENYNLRHVRAYGDAYGDALKLMKSEDSKVFDISLESDVVREAYGKNELGSGCLLARRLVERGVRFVEVMYGGWDHHNNIQTVYPEKCGTLDQALAALISDLSTRGLLQDTLVVLATEFGRTPKINQNEGRDHYPKVYSSLLAGGGIQGGQVYGASDEHGAAVAKDKVEPVDLNATIGYALGIPLDEVVMSPEGRPFQFAHKGKPLTTLFG